MQSTPKSRSIPSSEVPVISAILRTSGPLGRKSYSRSIPTPDSLQSMFREVPRLSERSMHDVTTPLAARAMPSSTRGMGTYRH